MTVRLPFTLTPLDGEDFVTWLHAYAARLEVTPEELADALGLPDHMGDPGAWQVDQLTEGHIQSIRTASGLSEVAVQALLYPVGPLVQERRPVTSTPRRPLTMLQRLRHATTISSGDRLRQATTLRRERRDVAESDPAIQRAKRLPDQLWPAWAIRLADNDAFDPGTFRSSALVALLVPHSGLTLREIIRLVDERIQPSTVTHHLRRLYRASGDARALRILTELAFAIDAHDLPIDYGRRRKLTAAGELIDRCTWASLARKAEVLVGRQRRARYAGCYLYELLTGCNLHLAPLPYQIEVGLERTEYQNFVADLPRGLVDALHQHAQALLLEAGIGGEPLQWQPPAHWVTATKWPGSDPDQTDPDRIHRALLGRAPHTQVAASLGISTEHLRYVTRQHPRPQPAYPTRRTLVPLVSTRTSTETHAGPNTIYLDPAWLRQEYLTWRRGLPDIAAELGCHIAVLKKFAHEHGIPVRPPSGAQGFAHLDAPGLHPSQVPEPLRSALTGREARKRLERFVVIADHPSLTQAARALGTQQNTLTLQLQNLERACGGLLLHRNSRPRSVGPLTPLGEQLRQQALEHLALTASK